MARPRGKRVPVTVEEVTPADALEYEREGTWPSWRLRWSFWDQDTVPHELQNGAEPDPRRILSGMDVEAHREEVSAWNAARLCWLEEGCP
jgi:hypothetical protein